MKELASIFFILLWVKKIFHFIFCCKVELQLEEEETIFLNFLNPPCTINNDKLLPHIKLLLKNLFILLFLHPVYKKKIQYFPD